MNVALEGWKQTSGEDVMAAKVQTGIVDYTLDDVTKKAVSGDRDHERFLTCRCTLARMKGVKTEKTKRLIWSPAKAAASASTSMRAQSALPAGQS